MREQLIRLREDALSRFRGLRRGHTFCPEGELWMVLAYVIERLLGSGLC
jgi:hypothetical protein